MGKKVVVITGSPRKGGNSFAMVDAFVDAAEKLGHEVTRFDAAFMKIGGCHACKTCYSAGKACGFNDDFNTIAPAILEADVLVFATPVNWYSIPAQVKAVIDRIYSLVVDGKDIAGKECALIACCEEEDPTVLDSVRVPMERTCALNKWDMVSESARCWCRACSTRTASRRPTPARPPAAERAGVQVRCEPRGPFNRVAPARPARSADSRRGVLSASFPRALRDVRPASHLQRLLRLRAVCMIQKGTVPFWIMHGRLRTLFKISCLAVRRETPGRGVGLLDMEVATVYVTAGSVRNRGAPAR